MSGQLPAQIDPIRLADEGARLYGTLPGSEMSRLQELTLPNSRPEQVAVDLQFERTGQGERRMHGTIRTQVEMACKRCLKPLTVEVVAQPLFVLLQPGEAEPDEYEALVVEAPLSLAELEKSGLRRDKWGEAQTSQHNEFYWRLRVWRALTYLFPLGDE